MDYELNDQDRVDLVKHFFKRYGWWIVLAILLILIGFGINAYVQKREATANQNASLAYQAILTAAQNGATAQQVAEAANTLIKSYPGTVYATLSNLTLASISVQEGNLGNAENILTASLANNHKNTLTPIIQMRLARVFIAEKKYDEAIALLNNPPKGFAAPFELLKGDAQLAKGSANDAKVSYLAAQTANGQKNPLIAQLLTERLNSIGGNS